MALGPPPPPWPRLRQELSLSPGPLSRHGAPTYTLHDPVAHRFFRLGWLEMEILSRWRLGDPTAIIQDISANTTLEPTPADVDSVVAFLRNNGLTVAVGPADSGRLKDLAARQKVGPGMFLVKNYLFLRVPLFKPDHFLRRTLPLVRPLFTRLAWYLIIITAVAGLLMVLRQGVFFRRELEMLFSVKGAIMVLVAMGLSKAAHELGHAYAAKLMGLRVPAMGMALMCFYPMLWTDTTEAWKCARRGDRLLIGLSGVGAELGLAALASWAWLLLPAGIFRDMALTLTGVTWITTLTINANPFMRYDAYYLLSDFFEMPMLQNRAFVYGKWFLRGKILGLDREPPETVSRAGSAALTLYAYATWVYRLFLFLGIAFLVYHLFFKALGLVLFLVEIIWFLLWPILKELIQWYGLRSEARLTVWGGVLLLLVASLFWPWRGGVVAPAILDAEKTFTFHAPIGAQLATELPPVGALVQPGQELVHLQAPDLDFKLKINALSRKALEPQIAAVGLAPELWLSYATQRKELDGILAEEAGLLANRDRLIFRAPFAGEVREIAVDLTSGQWVAPREPLLLLIGGQAVVEAMVPEEDAAGLAPGDRGIFLAGSGGEKALPIKIISISPGTVSEVTKPALASTKGGPLPVRQGSQGQLWPEKAVYLVRCEVEGLERPPAALTGRANLRGERRSLAGRALYYLAAAGIRESGW